MAGTVLLVSTSVACDMQQDRSTGWRLGTNRVMQFRYQAAGIFVGALLAVGFARLFMAAYPVLLLDQTAMSEGQQPAQWNAAMTFKFVGILKSLTDDKPYQRTAIWIGVGTGLLIELVRKLWFASERWQSYKKTRAGGAVDFVLDSTVLSSPYALSFGGFVNLRDVALARRRRRRRQPDRCARDAPKARAPGDDGELPSDMTSTSLFGGGLIAGDALAALGLGLIALGALVVG